MDSAYAAWAARWRVPLGFLLGAAYLIFCRPTVRLLIAGGTVAAAGLALRAYAAGHLAKNQRLAMGGPYAYTRNPLYLGSALLGAGLAVAGGWKEYRWILALAYLVLFAAIYGPVIRREEEYLRREFGEVYDRYAQRVPLFFPRLHRAEGGEKFQWKQYRKNHEYKAFLGFLAVMIFLAFKVWLR
jgi:protein-S-isoprenylcysteine O-methyltransferase Ste14